MMVRNLAAHSAVANMTVLTTTTLLANTEDFIAGIMELRDTVVPEHCALLTKRSANSLLFTAHVSLRDRIAYEQQKRAVTRQKNILVELESQKDKWSAVLEKARERKKQLKRLQNVQQELKIIRRLPNRGEQYERAFTKE